MTTSHLAIDLGAESGRAVVGTLSDRLELREIARVPNQPLQLPDRLAWNITGLHRLVLDALAQAGDVTSVSIDSWAIDFGLLREDGSLLALPRSYRDPLTAGMLGELDARIGLRNLYQRTGIQMMEPTTSCQLLALSLRDAAELREARRLLLIPDLLRYWLGCEPRIERTNASTTQLLSPDGSWDSELVELLGVAPSLLPPVVESTEIVGAVGDVHVVAGASHDTAAAVAGTPLTSGSAFISSGTWSLVGVERSSPVIDDRTYQFNLTNEHGVLGTTRLLRNVMGLWLLQECRRRWSEEDGVATDYSHLLDMAANVTPGLRLIDPDDASFLRPGDMPALIAEFCVRSGQDPPSSRADLVRCIVDSLALRYRWAIEALELCTGERVKRINVVGGGSRNTLLTQATADACGVTVEAGLSEATAIGNILVQAIACGELADLAEARDIIRRSVTLDIYEPRDRMSWDRTYERFCALTAETRRPEKLLARSEAVRASVDTATLP